MEVIQIVLASLAIVSAAISLYFSFKAMSVVEQAKPEGPPEPPKPKKMVVPGCGVFTIRNEKKKPKYHSDQEAWEKEQNLRHS